tara:strand:- start:2552 stop:2719 length:168 start_codon:yes stop_codon:yes gene_type:complete
MCKIGFNTNNTKERVGQIVVMTTSIVLLLIWVPLRNTAAPSKLIQGKSIQANTTL